MDSRLHLWSLLEFILPVFCIIILIVTIKLATAPIVDQDSVVQYDARMSPKKPRYFEEFTADIKNKKLSKFYVPLLLTRRIIFWIWLVVFNFVDNIVLSSFMFGAQILYTISMFILRPYNEHKENLIECLNEVFYVVLLGGLLHFNSADRWTGVFTQIYLWILMSNNFVILIIVVCKYSLKFIYSSSFIKIYILMISSD